MPRLALILLTTGSLVPHGFRTNMEDASIEEKGAGAGPMQNSTSEDEERRAAGLGEGGGH